MSHILPQKYRKTRAAERQSGSTAEQPTTPVSAPPAEMLQSSSPSVFRVEFWVLGSAASLAGSAGSLAVVARGWQCFNVGWAEQWGQIPALVHEWENLGGLWVRSQLRIEEYQRGESGHFIPTNRM